ncbi:unnamed protein product [Taenia asiatica]|uniref:RUN domain-containing protein n=1 Tax=Taenia asiatica TaxID=60517 RepID=A0A0R3VW57_TAEAS|nr:unnamed protein product [Taenia asiatica]
MQGKPFNTSCGGDHTAVIRDLRSVDFKLSSEQEVQILQGSNAKHWRTRPIPLILSLQKKQQEIYCQIRKFHENPDFYYQSNGSDVFTHLLSQSRKADAEFVELTSKAAWGWLFIARVPSHLKAREIRCILGGDLLELCALSKPNQFIASFTSLDAAKDSASAVSSRCDLEKALALVLHETDAVDLLLGGYRAK